MDNQIVIFHNDRKRIITKYDSYFVIEGKSQYLKQSLDESYIEFQYGPKLIVGTDFYNEGKIVKVEPIETKEKENKAVKVFVK